MGIHVDINGSERHLATLVAALRAAALEWLGSEPGSAMDAATCVLRDRAASTDAETTDTTDSAGRFVGGPHTQRVFAVAPKTNREPLHRRSLTPIEVAAAVASGVLASPSVRDALGDLIGVALARAQAGPRRDIASVPCPGGAKAVGQARPAVKRSKRFEGTPRERFDRLVPSAGGAQGVLPCNGRAGLAGDPSPAACTVRTVRDVSELHAVLLAICAHPAPGGEARGAAH